MTRILYLHVGPAKTGTSALQKVMCTKAFPNLHYPITGRWHDGAHHRLILSLAGHNAFQGETLLPKEEAIKQLKSEVAQTNKDILISSESIGNLKLILDNLSGWIEGTFDKMIVVMTMRHPIARAASSYNQGVKDPNVGFTMSPAEYLHERPTLCLLSADVKKFSQDGNDLLCIPYEPTNTFVERFLRTIGHGANIEIENNVNRSMSGPALATVIAMNRLVTDLSMRQTIFKALNEEEPVRVWQGNAFPFPSDVVDWYEETHIAPDREKLKALGYEYPGAIDEEAFQLSVEDERKISIFLQQQLKNLSEEEPRNLEARRIIKETLMLFRDAPSQKLAGFQ